jgi:MFS family permease
VELTHFLRDRINKLVLVSVTCLFSGVTVSLWLVTHSKGGTIAFAIMYGFISGGLVSIPPTTVAFLSKNQYEYSTRMGMAFTICSFGALVGNPIAGALITVGAGGKKSFIGPWLFAGGTMMAAAAFTHGAYYLQNKASGPSRSSSEGGGLERRRSAKWFRSLANEALTMQGAAFAL